MKELSKNFSDWYFSDTGGLMLTKHNRELYFALQDLVDAVAKAETDWEAERTNEPDAPFQDLLQRRDLKAALKLTKHLKEAEAQDWPSDDFDKMANEWRKDIRNLAGSWGEIDSNERFAVLQQVSSVLRTGLTNDVESRLR
jgi:hypothetical protein